TRRGGPFGSFRRFYQESLTLPEPPATDIGRLVTARNPAPPSRARPTRKGSVTTAVADRLRPKEFVMRMIAVAAFVTAVLIAFDSGARGEEKPGKAPAHPGLEKLKKLSGTWVEADKDGKPTDKVVSVVKVTAGGSTVQETL